MNWSINRGYYPGTAWLKCLLITAFLIFMASYSLLEPQSIQADPYFNSSEPDCDGSNSSVLFCEDFETNGVATVNGHGKWYAEDCDTANRNGGIATRTKGWCGTIFSNPITPDGAEICGGAGVNGTNCAGNHGLSQSGANMADHNLSGGAIYDHIFVRYYQKWNTGYSFGAEKVLTFNQQAGSGGIKWGNIHINCGGGGTPGSFQWQPQGGGFSNCLNITSVSPGVWYYIEIEAKLSTTSSSADGYLKIWVNNCGASGASCGPSPTLRLNQLNMSWPRQNASDRFGALWFEEWSNPSSNGTSYIDQIKVSQVGPIGFMGAASGGGDTIPPAPPSNLRVL
jgi:hypothetical protein